MTKNRNLSDRLPEYIRHPHTIIAAFALSVVLVAAPAMHWRASNNASRAAEAEAETRQAVVAPESPTIGTAAYATDELEATEPVPANDTELVAFYANFDELGLASLQRNAEHVDILMPMWFHLGSDGQLTFDAAHAARVGEIIAAKNPDMKVMPIVNNYDKAAEQWNAPQVGALIADPARRVQIAEHIVSTLASAGYDGVNIDFESFTETDRGNLVAFMAELYPRAKAAGLEVSMDVIVSSRTYDHAALAQHVDYLVPMMYDEHWKTSPAGPIASIPWFDRTLARFIEQVPADKVMVGMGVYSYDWTPGTRARSLTYDKAVALAQSQAAPIGLVDPALNSAFTYADAAGAHEVWMLDAVSAFNQMRVASGKGVRGYAIWRLGAEDPTLWNVLPNRDRLDRAVAESLVTDKRSIAYDDARGLVLGAVQNP